MIADGAAEVGPGGNRLGVARLTLTGFRSWGHLRLETEIRPVVLTGPNGAGKTNILEALSFLSPGRGLRRARLSEVARLEAGVDTAWAVAASLVTPAGEVEVGTGREAGSERRVVRIDGQPAKSQTALGEVASLLWLTPAMDRLFLEGAAGRRRFLDRLVYGLDSGHAQRSTAYEHALRERSRLLRGGRAEAGWLGALEETMARHGVAIAVTRREAAERLNAACAEGVGPFPAAGVTIEGEVEAALATTPPDGAAAALAAALARARRRDAEAGGAAFGPHRSDLAVRHRGKDMPAGQCSTGEQKALLISLVLGQARVRAVERGVAPMLLLDEVAAHLDETRRGALFDELCAMGAQSWLTGTEPALFAGLAGRAQFFRVRDATVTPQQEL